MSTVKIMDIQVLLDIYRDMRAAYHSARISSHDYWDMADRAQEREDKDFASFCENQKKYYSGTYLGISDGMYALRDVLKDAGMLDEIHAIENEHQ